MLENREWYDNTLLYVALLSEPVQLIRFRTFLVEISFPLPNPMALIEQKHLHGDNLNAATSMKYS